MSAFSNFLENRLLQTTLGGSENYVVPFTVRITNHVDTDTYTVTINGTDYDEISGGGDTESDVLTALAATITGGADPVTAAAFTDLDGNAALKIAQDGTWANIVVTASTSGASTVSVDQEVYAALYTTNPTDADSGTEVSGVNYTREIPDFGAAASGVRATQADCQFNVADAGGWGTITHVGIRDDISAGNLLYHGALAVSKAVAESDSFVFRSGDLSLTLD